MASPGHNELIKYGNRCKDAAGGLSFIVISANFSEIGFAFG